MYPFLAVIGKALTLFYSGKLDMLSPLSNGKDKHRLMLQRELLYNCILVESTNTNTVKPHLHSF